MKNFRTFAFFATLLAGLIFLALAFFMPEDSKLYVVLTCVCGFACVLICYDPKERLSMWKELSKAKEKEDGVE